MFSPLAGVRVVSFTHFLQGPSASQLLADLGAEVIKVEPLGGAFERSWSAPDAYLDGESVFFLLGNRNVRSVAVDLKAEPVRAAIQELVAGADVLVESFRPGAMRRLGYGPEEMRARNPRLVYCSLSGYGSSGPYADRPGQDVLIQALSGLASINGREGDPPTPAGASLVDQHGAVLAAFAVLAALLERARTGEGTLIESNLLSAALDLQIEPLSYFLNGWPFARSRSGVSSGYYKAPYGVYRTADGHLCLSLNSLDRLAAVFADPWFAEVGEEHSYARREEVNARVAEHLATATTAEWGPRLAGHGAWHAPVQGYADVVDDPQVRHNGSIVDYEHPAAGPVRLLGHPVSYDGARPEVRTPPPPLGADTAAVLGSLGLSAAAIRELADAGLVVCGD